MYFSGYAGTFGTDDPECRRNIRLKVAHTFRVCREAEKLAQSENFSEREKNLLFHAAMLHDFSRFEQIIRFKTMNDLESFDHGERSFELVSERKKELLGEFDAASQQIILCAVRYHNRRNIPAGLTADEEKILCAVRDADKTDIMKILIDYLKNPENPAIVYKLSGTGGLSSDVKSVLLAGKSPDNRMLQSRLDFLAAKFAWGYDLKSGWSCREFLKRRYMQTLRSLLPQDMPVLDEISNNVIAFMQKKGNGNV